MDKDLVESQEFQLTEFPRQLANGGGQETRYFDSTNKCMFLNASILLSFHLSSKEFHFKRFISFL